MTETRELPSYDSLTLDTPRITYTKFLSLLKSKNSPAVPEAADVWAIFIARGVEPSFALAQFRVESQYGTAGYAKITGSWGNMLYDKNLTTHASGKYSPGNGYTYATYNDYKDAATDYATYLHWYKDEYQLETIYEATARWIGKPAGSSGHLSYVSTIVNDMIRYEYPTGGYESGDKMIYAGPSLDRVTGKLSLKYPVTYGMALYRGTDGSYLKKYTGVAGNAWWLGFVNGGTAWGALFIGTTLADPDATLVYIKNPDPKKIIKV
jgi:hypothetical protein